MLRNHASRLGALILGGALALPLAAQQPPAADPAKPPAAPAAPAAAPATAAQPPAAPTAAPAAAAQPAAAPAAAPATGAPVQAAPPPVPAAGSTAVPGWNVPPQWEKVDRQPQYASVPGRETNILIQSSGREWREFRNGPVIQYGGWVIAGVLALLVLFYFVRGRIRLHGAPTGRMIERFNGVERVAHWTMAISFVVLAISGIVILWGKYIILPWLGYSAFATLTVVAKNLHNFVGPLFIFSLVVMFLVYVKDNLPASSDGAWLARAGGMFSKTGDHPASGRFNAGEKLWFWGGVVILGLAVSVTGLILDFPNWNQGREAMQQANLIHAIAAILFMAASLAHIYLGTIGMEGAYKAMREGYVDETWAREHHSLWYDDVKAGRRPEKLSGGTAQPATGD